MKINRGRGYEEGLTYQGQTAAAARVGWGFSVAAAATQPACDEMTRHQHTAGVGSMSGAGTLTATVTGMGAGVGGRVVRVLMRHGTAKVWCKSRTGRWQLVFLCSTGGMQI